MSEAPTPLPPASEDELEKLLQLALQLGEQAAEVHGRHELGSVDTKSSATDPVTEVDRNTETLLVDAITAARPDDGLLGEEGASAPGSSGFRWVIDPLDGTVNYVYGYPSHSVSIGVEYDGMPVVGVVVDTALGDVYASRQGGGATCNGEPMRMAGASGLDTMLLGTGFGYDADVRAFQGRALAEILPKVRDIRRGGSVAVDLCWVASGRLDGHYEIGPNPWDVTAGLIIIREAGGVAAYDHDAKRILACAPHNWNDLTDVVRGAETTATVALHH